LVIDCKATSPTIIACSHSGLVALNGKCFHNPNLMRYTISQIMKIYVFGQRELIQQLKTGHQPTSHLISIGNPGKGARGTGEDSTVPDIFMEKYTSILRLEFYDVEYKRHLGKMRPRKIPTKRDVRKVIRYFRKTRNSATGYTIHCWQGISRSTAVALCLLYLIHGDETIAAEELLKIRREALPHSRLVAFFDEIMKSSLNKAINPIREKHFRELKQWFFDQIEDGDALIAELEEVDE
jgi:predicted protein tyrosine phosphatase